MSSTSSVPDGLWDALELLQLRLSPAVTPSGKLGGVLGGSGVVSTSAPMDDTKPAPESVLVSLRLVRGGAGNDVCGGRVGADRVKFCSAECAPGSSSCGKVAAHVKKVDLEIPAFYIHVPNHPYAFVQPALVVPESGFPPEIRDMLQGSRSVQAWVELFTAVKDIHLLDDDDRQSIIQRFSTNSGYSLSCGPTPMRFKKRRVDIQAQEGLDIEDATSGSWVVDSPNEPSVIPPQMYTFEEKVMHVIDSWDKVVLSGKHQRQTSLEMNFELKQFVELVDNKVVGLIAVVGKTPEDSPGPTVWTSIGAHKDAIQSGQKMFQDFKDVMEASYKSMDTEVKEIRRGIRQTVLPTMNMIADRVNTTSSGNNGRGLDEVWTTLEEFRNELAQVRAGRIPGPQGYDGGDIAELRSEVALLKDEVAFLKTENSRLQAESNTDTIEFGGHIFNSTSTYVTWVATHIPSAYIGFCFDFISVLECFTNYNRIAEDGLKMAESVKKAGYKDKQTAIIDQSFGCTFPKVFGDEQDSSNPAKKMAKLKTVDDWDNPTANTGLKVRINTFITSFRKTIEAQISSMFSFGTPSNNFFSSLMQHTVKFWEAFASWITRFERELTHRSGGDNFKMHQENTWNLICWMIHSMFVELNARRSPGSVGITLDDDEDNMGRSKIEKCAAILHGTLSAHKFMAELISAEFIRHPIFASTMDEFLLTNKAAHVTVEMLLSKVKKLEERVNGLQAVCDKTKEEVKRAVGGKAQK